MQNKIFKPFLIVNFLIILLSINSETFSQNTSGEPVLLVLNQPLNREITDGKPLFAKVSLSAGETGVVGIEYLNTDVLTAVFNPAGEKFLRNESPTIKGGTKILLISAMETGEYKIEIAPKHKSARAFEVKIELNEVRQTIPHDIFVNESLAKIHTLFFDPKPFTSMKIAERRDAIQRHTEVVRLAKLIENKDWQTYSLIVLGHAFYSVGEIQASLESTLQAQQIYRAKNDKHSEGLATNNLGILYKNIGEYERALAHFKETEELQQDANRFDKAILYSNLGSTYGVLGKFEKAIDYYQKSAALYAEMNFVSQTGPLLGAIGRIYLQTGEISKAIDHFQRGLKLTIEAKNRSETANIQLSLAKALWNSGDKKATEDLFLQAKLTAEEIGNPQFVVRSLYELAIVERDRGNFDKAVEYLEKGLIIIEKIRGELKNKSLQTTYFSTVQNFYELYTDLLIERARKNDDKRDISLAFELSERSRARSLIDILEEARIDFRQNVDAGLLEKEKDFNIEIGLKYQARERLLLQNAKPEEIAKINAEINGMETELQKTELQIIENNPQYANLTRGKTLSTKAIQNLLDSETVLLEYKLGKTRSYLWLVTGDSIDFYELPSREILENKTRQFYENISENAPEKAGISYELYEILLSKVKTQTAGKRLAVVADGILQYLPFSALKDQNSVYLADKNEIVFLPSASVLASLREMKPSGNKTLAVFADPVFDSQDSRIARNSVGGETLKTGSVLRDFRLGEDLPRLLASRQEAGNIAAFVDDNQRSVKLGFEANLENIETAKLSDYRILHFATHGILNTKQPELSGLVFSLYDEKGNPQRGFLSLNDIYNFDLSSDLVVLSACQTALGKDVRGEGLIGISRGFFYAGSKRIVASLWKVDDSATAEFMKRFYKNHLQKGMPASQALKQTKVEMKKIRRYQSPFFWSAFILLGDWK